MSKYAKISLTIIVAEDEAEKVVEELLEAEDLIKEAHWVVWDDVVNLAIEESELPVDSEFDLDDDSEESDPTS